MQNTMTNIYLEKEEEEEKKKRNVRCANNSLSNYVGLFSDQLQIVAASNVRSHFSQLADS